MVTLSVFVMEVNTSECLCVFRSKWLASEDVRVTVMRSTFKTAHMINKLTP